MLNFGQWNDLIRRVALPMPGMSGASAFGDSLVVCEEEQLAASLVRVGGTAR